MRSLATLKVPMDDKSVQDDIRLYVHQMLYRVNQFQNWPLEMKKEIEATLINDARGM
jgi:hypothetical protein